MLLAPYQEFTLQQSLLGSIYPMTPQLDEGSEGYQDLNQAKSALKKTVTDRGQFHYSFKEYFSTWFLSACCCCCIKKKEDWWRRREWRYNRYEESVERMSKEVDVLKYISA